MKTAALALPMLLAACAGARPGKPPPDPAEACEPRTFQFSWGKIERVRRSDIVEGRACANTKNWDDGRPVEDRSRIAACANAAARLMHVRCDQGEKILHEACHLDGKTADECGRDYQWSD